MHTDSRKRQFFMNRYTKECFAVSRYMEPANEAPKKAKENRPPLRRAQHGSPPRFGFFANSGGRKVSPERRAQINKLLRKRHEQQMRAGAV
jgi:hypothetical protein